MSDIWSVLDTDDYVVVNRDVIHAFGLESAVLLGELASEYHYYERQGMLQDGRFFTSVANVEERTGLNEYKQRQCLKELQEKGIVTVNIQKHPNRRWIELNGNALNRELKNLKVRALNFKGQSLKFYGSIKNNNIRKTNKDIYSQDCKSVIDHLNERTGSRFTDCESNIKYIRARLKDGFTVGDFFEVIDKKADEWEGTEMSQYLRPQTLFRPSNFESYLNQKRFIKRETHDDRYLKQNGQNIDDIERIMGEV